MKEEELKKVIEFIEGFYHRKLDLTEIKTLSQELKDFTYEDFENDIKSLLLKKIDYFTVQGLHKIIEENKELEEFKKSLGINSFDELYEN